jgi:hypothetical protein
MYGVDLESHQLNDSALLMEIMELQENITDETDKTKLASEIEGFRATMMQNLKDADELFVRGAKAYLSPITALVIRAQYFQRLIRNAEHQLQDL